MREPDCPYCKTKLTEHGPGRCLDYWFAELVMGFVWVKHGEGHTSMSPGQRFLVPPSIFDQNKGFATPPFVAADGSEPLAVTPQQGGSHLVPCYSTDKGQAVPAAERLGALGFNVAFVHYTDEARWKCSAAHKGVKGAVGGMTHESIPFAVVSAAVEAVDLLRRYRARGAAE